MPKELIQWLDDRLKRNKTATIVFSGGLGSGKSYSCLSAADEWYRFHFDRPFPIENCCFNLEKFMNRIIEGKLEPGEVLIMEETGALIPSREFMNKINRIFGYYMQTFRALQVFIFFNLPIFKLMDSSVRILVNANFITQGIDRTKNVCEIKPFFNQLNQQSGKIYPKYMRKRIERDGYIFRQKVDRFYFRMPKRKLREGYEKAKREFLKSYGAKVAEEIRLKGKPKILYTHKCNHCKYEWKGEKKEPRHCPECHKRKWNEPI